MPNNYLKPQRPEILSPAGNKDMFLAALAAGADSIYCGLKHFSARMEADNFSIAELAALREAASAQGSRTYCAFNTLIKPGDLQAAGRLLDRLIRHVQPQALIFQDLALPGLARELGFQGELHLSTLANPGTLSGLPAIASLGVNRLVLPRELNIEEVQRLSEACPQGLDLEVFIHGALCYGVSGRCYWSSWLGGKSSLRGRCVQPCRRLYSAAPGTKRFFSCLDLSLDVLVKPLLEIPGVAAWKIEGRKKGPHYVFYTTKAYQLLRDHPADNQAKKQALDYLHQSLGRKTTHSNFLPQRPHNPIQPDQDTGSGLFISKLGKTATNRYFLRPRRDLLPGDLLRIGYQDLPGHQLTRIKKYIPKGSRYQLPRQDTTPAPGTPAFLIDRREPELRDLLQRRQQTLSEQPPIQPTASRFEPTPRPPASKARKRRIMRVFSDIPIGKLSAGDGLWLTPSLIRHLSKTLIPKLWFWLPPVIWPNEEAAWSRSIKAFTARGAKAFVLNAPWQIGLFPSLDRHEIWAGPFCNISNAYAVSQLQDMGFAGVFVSPELNREDFLSLPPSSPLPLGIVLAGSWPLCISRFPASEIQTAQPVTSPKNETSWVIKQGQNFLHFPNWNLDISAHKTALEQAGYALFATLHHKRPPTIPKAQRSSTFNWDLRLL